jgi:U3 small nucleolar RNA-associated protein 19
MSSLAKVLSEPFSKPLYNIEDFLDHSYGTMLDADLRRWIKKVPVINHEKSQIGALLEGVWDM